MTTQLDMMVMIINHSNGGQVTNQTNKRLIGFVVEKMNKLLGPSLSRMIAPFFLLAILAEGQLAILRCNYEIYQLHHSVWNCQMRPGSILAVINHTNIFQLFCSVFLQPFLPSSDLSLFAIFHLFLDPRSEESHAHLINWIYFDNSFEDII